MYYFKSLIFFVIVTSFISCAYYNTLFNAQARYDDGIKKIEESNEKNITSEIRNDFQAAIDKCWKLINIYSDSSKYADDALLLIGKSHYQMEDYVKAERFLTQFVDRYRESDLVAEAYLWLGMSLIELERYDEAQEKLKRVLDEDDSDDLNARAYLNSGRIYLKQKNYDRARIQFAEVFNLTSDDEIKGNSQFLIAETYYLERNYAESIANYDKVLEYDASVDLLFKAILKKVDGYLNLGDYKQAISTLESVSTDTKFLYKKSVVLALTGKCYEDQGKFLEATDIYYDVLETYPRTEGSAIAAYGMGKLMEFAYGDLDSAQSLYKKVGLEYRDSEYKTDADERAKMLSSYQKIIRDIEKDINDLSELSSITEESEETAEDSSEIAGEDRSADQQKNGKNQPKIRSESEIKKSLEKNNFAKAEFFLLTLASYDSAVTGYNTFIQLSEDSILVPKAQYALYYIYAYELLQQEKADSIKKIILNTYPQSAYARYFDAQKITGDDKANEDSPYKYLYLRGEAMMSDAKYAEAIDLFNQIAEEDSGSQLAQKARYATAWIYEKKLEDMQNAVTAYTALVKEYPNTEAGKIAQNKIKIPVEEKINNQSMGPDSTMAADSSSVFPFPDKEQDVNDQNTGEQEQNQSQIPEPTPDDQ